MARVLVRLYYVHGRRSEHGASLANPAISFLLSARLAGPMSGVKKVHAQAEEGR
jgi:hypothetical protein